MDIKLPLELEYRVLVLLTLIELRYLTQFTNRCFPDRDIERLQSIVVKTLRILSHIRPVKPHFLILSFTSPAQ